MPDARQALNSPLDYDPARADRIRELVEQMRASDNPAEIDRLENELDELIFQ
jgi:hypothetical protein